VIDDLPVAAWLVAGAESEEGLEQSCWMIASRRAITPLSNGASASALTT